MAPGAAGLTQPSPCVCPSSSPFSLTLEWVKPFLGLRPVHQLSLIPEYSSLEICMTVSFPTLKSWLKCVLETHVWLTLFKRTLKSCLVIYSIIILLILFTALVRIRSSLIHRFVCAFIICLSLSQAPLGHSCIRMGTLPSFTILLLDSELWVAHSRCSVNTYWMN